MSAATRSGLLFGVFAFFSSLGLGILFPLCSPLCGIVWGIGAGLAAVAWSEPNQGDAAPARNGALAGGMAGIGALLGLALGVVTQFALLGGQQISSELSADFSRELGFNIAPGEFSSAMQWIGVSVVACCLGLATLAVMAIAGAAGSAVYASRKAKQAG